MPASRSARAMIFAPRSCPSRPGLATTTRILPRCVSDDEAEAVGEVMGRQRLLPRTARRSHVAPREPAQTTQGGGAGDTGEDLQAPPEPVQVHDLPILLQGDPAQIGVGVDNTRDKNTRYR